MAKSDCTMENLNSPEKNKYQVTIYFENDEQFLDHYPTHSDYFDSLIDKEVIDYFTISLETNRCWIVFSAINKIEVSNYLQFTHANKLWTVEIEELFVFESQSYRLPALQLN